ncbi:MAG TPA: hypothetical protein VGK21_01880 [Candidatus Angelobacter sp.]|jgi:hypothetical protein
MDTNLEEKISIELSKGELLVIFEFLARSYDAWQEAGNTKENTFVLSPPDVGERIILWRLEGEIERTLAEIFSTEYRDLVGRAKQTAIRNG